MAITDLELGPGFQLSKYQLGPARRRNLISHLDPASKRKYGYWGEKMLLGKVSFVCQLSV